MPRFCFYHILTSSGITEQAHRVLQHGIYSLNRLPRSTEPCKPVPGVQFLGTARNDVKRKTAWVEPSKGRLTPLYTSLSLVFSPPLSFCAAFQFLNAWNRLELNRPLHRFINTYPRTLNLKHWRNAVSLRYKNRAEITVFMFELVVRFLCWRQIYPVYCEHSLKFPVSNANKCFNQSCYFLTQVVKLSCYGNSKNS